MRLLFSLILFLGLATVGYGPQGPDKSGRAAPRDAGDRRRRHDGANGSRRPSRVGTVGRARLPIR